MKTNLLFCSLLAISVLCGKCINAKQHGCIVLIGGVGTPNVEYYQPDSDVECNIKVIGTVSPNWLRGTDYTSGCLLSKTKQIIVREAFDNPSVLYNLMDGSAEEIPLPYNTSDGVPRNTWGSTSAVSLDGSVCVSCGGFSDGPLNECYLYTAESEAKKWTPLASLPKATAYAASVEIGQSYFVSGGFDGENALDGFYHLDISTNTWSTLPPMPSVRWQHAAVSLSSTKILVCGGYRYRTDCILYDVTINTWRTVNSLKDGRDYFSLVNDNGDIFAVGGYTYEGRSASVEVYDVQGDRWMPGKSLENGRAAFVTVATNETTTVELSDQCILLIGGVGTPDVEYYHPAEGVQCNIDAIGTLNADWLNETAWTSGCYLANSKEIVIREAYGHGDKPPVLYGLKDSSAAKLNLPYNSTDGEPRYTGDSTASPIDGSKCLSCGGGFKKSSEPGDISFLDTCYLYDSADKRAQWTSISPMPTKVQAAASVTVQSAFEERFYVVGGYDGSKPLEQLYRYNSSSQNWSSQASMSSGRYYHSAAVLSPSEFIVCGGYYRRRDCEVYSWTLDRWCSVGSLNIGRMNFALVAFQGDIYALGGLASDAVDVVEKYDRETKLWMTVTKNLKQPRRGFVAVVV